MKTDGIYKLHEDLLLPPVDGNCALECSALGEFGTLICAEAWELTAEMITADVKVALVNIIANIDNVRIVVR